MKIFITLFIAFLSLSFYVNMRPVHADFAVASNPHQPLMAKGSKLKVDAAASKVAWIGTKPSGKHNGEIKISNGIINVNGGNVVSGKFDIDMKTLNNLDLEGKGKSGLEGHLKSADFFDVEKFPTATFELTEISTEVPKDAVLADATHVLGGNLTLKGVTKHISFPAKVVADKKKLNAVADFNIDRTEWGMTYGADGKVAKEINLKLNIVAAK